MNEHCGCEDTAVKELESGLKKLSNTSYDSIDKLMRKIMKKHDMTAKQLHNSFVDKNKKTPDTWIKDMKESLEVAKQGLEGKRYCRLCRKSETQQECKFGPDMWNKFSIATVHPVNMPEEVSEGKRGLWDNINARRKKGLPPKKPGEKGYPKTLNVDEGLKQAQANVGASKCWTNKKVDPNKPTKIKGGKEVPNCVPAEDTCLTFSEFMAEVAAWQRKEGKNPEGGLNKKGIASYRKENPGSKLSMAVTTPPSELDPDSKAAKRRKSFCARMGGMPGPMKDEKGRPTRKALSLRKWNC